jgi:hypothetical protein
VTKFNPSGTDLIYSTYLGGNGSFDAATSIVVDSSGYAFIAGHTIGGGFPTTEEAFSKTNRGRNDVFIARLNPDGTDLVYSTLLGGSFDDSAAGLAIDSAGNAYIAGITSARLPYPPFLADFPTTPGAFQIDYGGGDGVLGSSGGDAFVTKLDPMGKSLVYSTYLGGSKEESVGGIAINPQTGDVWVAGVTWSPDFPLTNDAARASLAGNTDVFLTRLNSTGSALTYSTLFGGSGGDGVVALALDQQGSIFIAGGTTSPDFPVTPETLHKPIGTNGVLYIARLSPDGANIIYAATMGNTGSDHLNGFAVNLAGETYIAGATSSDDFPTTPDALRQIRSTKAFNDMFVAKLNSDATSLVYSTYFGGTFINEASAIAVDSFGNAYITGNTYSNDFPTTPGAFQAAPKDVGGRDAFVVKIGDASSIARIDSAEIVAKKLQVRGANFYSGAVILVNGDRQKTANDDATPDTLLVSKKARKKIKQGQTVTLQVKNTDGALSNEFTFTRP